jgi:rSAM/selenodomain-associated transferase 1
VNENLYGIMIKYPEPGKVKTRLAKDLGSEKAAHICRQTVELVMANTIPVNFTYDRIVFYDSAERQNDFAVWLPGEQLLLQQGADVGERMDNAIRDLLKMGAKKAVITGADIPELTAPIIREAFAALDDADIVIGPAKDGGYYLIGMKSPHPEIFQGIPWSTGKVFEETSRIIEKLHLSCRSITTLSDLDTADDYKKMFLL